MNKLYVKSKSAIHVGFEIGLFVKLIAGIIELIVGFLLLYSPDVLIRFVNFIVRGELSEDPTDLIVNLLIKWVDYSFIGFRILVSVYLLVVGIMKIGFVIALFKKKLKAYVIYEWILAAFVVYQSYRYVVRHEIFVFWLTLIDIFVMVFIWLEYLRLKKKI